MIIDPCLSTVLVLTTAPSTIVSFAAFRLTSHVCASAEGALSFSYAAGMPQTQCEWRTAGSANAVRTCPLRSFDSSACLRDTDGMLIQMSDDLALASAHEYISPRRQLPAA